MVHHLAQVNIARMRAPLDDPVMAGFMDNLDHVNGLGASMPGFVWIMGEEGDGNTDLRFFDDPELIANVTVWEDLASLEEFVLRTEHVDFLRRRREWFVPIDEAAVCGWWVPAGHRPTLEEAEDRLRHLREHGSTPYAFALRDTPPPPD